MAKHEDFIVMGCCADVILTNNHIPHISIFITAPFEQRLRRAMELHPGLSAKGKASAEKLDRDHQGLLPFLYRKKWGEMPPIMTCA